jgi:hypothetical protein
VSVSGRQRVADPKLAAATSLDVVPVEVDHEAYDFLGCDAQVQQARVAREEGMHQFAKQVERNLVADASSSLQA